MNILNSSYPIDKSDWIEVFSACVGKSMAIQQAAAKYVVKGRNWNVDFGRGVIAFGEDEFPIQLIGSEAANEGTWLWGYENVNGFDESLIRLANDTKEKAKKWELEPVTIPGFELSDMFNGHTLSMLTCGIADEKMCYYRCPHSGGAVFVALSDIDEKVFEPVSAPDFANTVMQCIQQYYLDHKILVESFLMWNETPYDWKENAIIAHFEQDLQIEFEEGEESLRICSIKSV